MFYTRESIRNSGLLAGLPAANGLQRHCHIACGPEMSIKKQDFYEGAALHLLARTNQVKSIRYDAPFYLINEELSILLKYCTRVRSPWGFTFTAEEQATLKRASAKRSLVIGLICGSDGVAAISYGSLLAVASPRQSAIHVACYRGHWEHYEVSGPDGTLSRRVSPSNWQKILENGVISS